MKNDQGAAQSTPELLPVVQADRKSAAEYSQRPGSGHYKRIIGGEMDHLDLVQAFARHRIEHTTPDRNAVLELLREARPLVAAMEMEGDLDIFDLLARIDAALTTTPEPTDPAGVSEMKADLVHFAKLIFKLDATVSNLVTGLEDEGDRIYLGSTNDADQLRELSGELEDAFYSTELTKYGEGRDVWAEMRELRERITELEAENFRLAAGQCVVENGLIGDEHGHFDCSLRTPPVLEVAKEALENLVASLDALIADSEGVYGLHLNGDPAPWSELTEGGRFEDWLIALEPARAALQTIKGAG